MKKTLILLLLILIPLASSYTEWHYHEDEFTHNNIAIQSNVQSHNPERLILVVGGEPISVQLSQCRELGTNEYCYDDYSFEHNKIEIDRHGQLAPAVLISINEIETEQTEKELGLELNYNQSPSLFKEYTFEAILINEGSGWINGADIEIEIPPHLEIDNGDFRQSDNKLYLEGLYIPPGSERVFRFDYTPKEYQSQDVLVRTSFIETQTETISIDVQKPYEAQLSLEPQTLRPNQEAKAVFKIKNNYYEDLSFEEFSIRASSGLETNTRDLTSVHSRHYTTEDVLRIGSEETYELTVSPQRPGVFNVRTNFLIKINDLEFSESFREEIDVSASAISMETEINKNLVKNNSLIELKASIKNHNEDDHFTNLDFKIPSLDFQKTIDLLEADSEKTITHSFNVTNSKSIKPVLEYRFYDRQEVLEEVHNITIIEDYLNLTVDFNKSSITPGEEVLVTTKIKSLVDNHLRNYAAEDLYAVNRISGDNYKSFNLEPHQELKLYNYTLEIPEDYEETLHIYTFLNNDMNFTHSLEVEGIRFEEPSSEDVEEIEREPQQSWLERLFDFVASLF